MSPRQDGGGVPSAPSPDATFARLLLVSVVLIASCGLVYELVAGALASYLLGDSVTWFSLVIGIYLSAMGVGAWLSKHVEDDLVARFIEIEIGVALVGGFSAPILYAGFALTPAFRAVIFVVVGLVGAGVGLELPLLLRILESRTPLKELLARVLFLDYAGSLLASLAFPLFLVPNLGLLRSSLALGLVNASVALVTTWLFPASRAVRVRLRVLALAAIAVLVAGLAGARAYEEHLDAKMFADPVVFSEQTAYQRIVVTHRGPDTRLFLDGNLQLSTLDEYRYHESLVHPAMARAAARERVLVLGGGDGMAVREILRWTEVKAVTLVDLDPAMTRLFTERPELAGLNGESFGDPRVHVVNDDAARWVETWEGAPWDVVIVDFPDPNHLALGKLYSTWFYRNLRRVLAPGAWIAVQSTSPFFSPDAYWCIERTMAQSGFATWPYHVWVPSFGDWGFVLARLDDAPSAPGGAAPSWEDAAAFPEGLRFLDRAALPALFSFPQDVGPRDVPVNRLDNQALVQLYARDWRDHDHR